MQTSTPLTKRESVSLKEHLESRITSVEKTIMAAYPSRDELLRLLEVINDRLTELEISKAHLDGKANQTQVIVFGAIAIVSFALTILDWLAK